MSNRRKVQLSKVKSKKTKSSRFDDDENDYEVIVFNRKQQKKEEEDIEAAMLRETLDAFHQLPTEPEKKRAPVRKPAIPIPPAPADSWKGPRNWSSIFQEQAGNEKSEKEKEGEPEKEEKEEKEKEDKQQGEKVRDDGKEKEDKQQQRLVTNINEQEEVKRKQKEKEIERKNREKELEKAALELALAESLRMSQLEQKPQATATITTTTTTTKTKNSAISIQTTLPQNKNTTTTTSSTQNNNNSNNNKNKKPAAKKKAVITPNFVEKLEEMVEAFNGLEEDTLFNSMTDEELSRLTDEVQKMSNKVHLLQKMAKERAEKNLRDEIAALRSQLVVLQASQEAKTECKICYEKPINVSLAPCGHRVMCSDCSKIMSKAKRECPVCRQRVQTFVVTYD